MNIIYEGVDITNSIDVRKACIYDNAGGIADSVELVFSDTKGLWSQWNPQKNDKVEVKESGFSSGLMFVDHLEQNRGEFLIKALSTPVDAKTCHVKSWENVRLFEIAGEIASNFGFELQTYNIQNWLYDRVDQIDETDFAFLTYRCMLEGYMLKICNRKIVIYDERIQEQQPASKTIYLEDFDGDYSFKSVSSGLYNSCVIRYAGTQGMIKSEFKPVNAPAGPVLKKNMYVGSQAEADRFTKGMLRYANKGENPGRFLIELNPTLAAGSCINVFGVGLADGKHVIEQVVHSLTDKKSILRVRKLLEGY